MKKSLFNRIVAKWRRFRASHKESYYTEDEARKIAIKYDLEKEFDETLDFGLTPDEALEEWDNYPSDEEKDNVSPISKQVTGTNKIPYSYDKYFSYLVMKLKGFQNFKEGEIFLSLESKMNQLENVNDSFVLYRYGEFYINVMLQSFGEKFVSDHEIVNGLHLTTFPRLVDVIIIDGRYFIITIIPNNKGKNIAACPDYLGCAKELPLQSIKHVFRDLMELEANGYVLSPRFRYCIKINDDGNIILPDFELYTKVEALKSGMISDVYNRYGLFAVDEEDKEVLRQKFKSIQKKL